MLIAWGAEPTAGASGASPSALVYPGLPGREIVVQGGQKLSFINLARSVFGAGANGAAPVRDAPFVPLGHQSVTVTSTAATLAVLLTAAAGAIASIPAGTKVVILQPRGDGIRYAHGGVTPTLTADATGIGAALSQDGQYPLRITDFSSLKLIAPSNTVLSVEFRG